MTRRPAPADPAAAFFPFSSEPGAILLETQRPGPEDRYSYLLRDPETVLTAVRPEEVLPALAEAEAWRSRGYAVAGFVAYEAGFALDRAFDEEKGVSPPVSLLWLGVFPGYLCFDHLARRWRAAGRAAFPPPDRLRAIAPPLSAASIRPRFSIPRKEYFRKVEEVRRAIARGEVYQANLTGSFSFPAETDPFSLYLRLRAVQPVPYGAFLRTQRECIVSQSPELFFRVRGERIEVRPMKGTAPRGLTEAENHRAAKALRADPKNRAENVMIVDLLRNDLGRVCEIGSVRVPRLFEVQRFSTVLQMVSTVTGRLKAKTTLADLFRALFPCGSVTGAPKIAAMRLLHRLEAAPRGVYTGAIGILLPGGDTTFSVAIRTAVVREGQVEAGAGGGIVWDSKPQAEYREVLQKARYLVEPPIVFELIETFLFVPDIGFRFLSDHLRRLAGSARYFGFRFRREKILAALDAAARGAKPGDAPSKVRLFLSRNGLVSVELLPLPASPAPGRPWRVALSNKRVFSRDPFVRHKTTNRGWRDEQLRKAREAGFDEILFLNERGEVTEGAITNLFVESGGTLATPAPSCGLLEGIMRGCLLAKHPRRAREGILFPEDLGKAGRILLTNSVRGEVPATVVPVTLTS